MKKINNNLPKSWCVKNDDSQLFKDTVIKYLNINSEDGDNWGGTWCGFYGIKEDGKQDLSSTSEAFTTILTIEKFIELSKPIIKKKPMKKSLTLEQLEKQKAEIDKQIEALKNPKIKKGTWYNFYKGKQHMFLICVTKVYNGDISGYGFNRGVYEDYEVGVVWFRMDDLETGSCSLKEATPKEIETALIKEAKLRGFVLNKNKGFKSTFDDRNMIRPLLPYSKKDKSLTWYFDEDFHGLRSNNGIDTNDNTKGCSNPLIFKNGKWCEIVDIKPKQEPIFIGGYEVKKSGSNIKIGCKTIPMSTVEAIYKMMVECDWGVIWIDESISVDIEDLNKIVKMK